MDSQITTPIISVVIPLYNKESYITRALNSVLAQTIQNFEIIIVNDGSTDGSEKKVMAYNDPRIHLINQKNQGVSVARNNGVKASNSELIAFLDADDEWLPEYLETVLRLHVQYPGAGLYTTRFYMSIGTTLKKGKYYCFEEGWEGVVPNIFKTVALANYGPFPGNSSSTMIPKTIFLEQKGFREGCSAAEDIDLWSRICLKYPNVHTEQYLSIYHNDDMYSLSKNHIAYCNQHPFEKSLEEMAKSGIFSPSEYSTDLKLYVDSINIFNATRHINCGNKINALRYLLKIRHISLYQKVAVAWIQLLTPTSLLPLLRKIYNRFF